MSGQYFHRTLVALAEVRRGVLERLPDGAGGTGGDRPVLPVLQLRAAASEPSVSDAGRSLPGRKCAAVTDRKSVVEGKRVDLGGRRVIKKKSGHAPNRAVS